MQLSAGLHQEIGILSKKKPDKAVNGWKLKFVNKILEKANGILEERYRPFGGFEAFEAVRLNLAEGQKDDARVELEKAKGLVEETGYHRRDGEVQELEECF